MATKNAQQHVQCHVYVIDEQCHLVHLSEETATLFPEAKLGEACYAALRGESAPCEDCPWRGKTFEHDGAVRKVVYNTDLHQWLELTCVSVNWPGQGTCTVVASKGIDGSNKDSFGQFTQQTIYDELLEINLSENSFQILYYETEKYELPLFTNSLDDISDIAEYLIHPDDRRSFIKFWNTETIKRKLEQRDDEIRGEFRQKLKTGDYRWTSQTLTRVRSNDDGADVLMCFILDIEEQKRRSAKEVEIKKLQYKALSDRDTLTGLYRTEVFFQKAEDLIASNPDKNFEMLCLDMKNFRLFNEWYSREAGDQLLTVIAARFKEIKREVGGVAGYFGADNFALVLPQGSGVEEKIGERVEMPFVDFDDNIGFFPVVGLCKIDDPSLSLHTVYDRAVMAKNLIKRSYSTRIAWYEESTAKQVDEDTRLLLEIQHALKDKEFILHWQPQCDIRNGCIVGVEALVRWQHSERGLVYPGEFIPLLEKTGYIVNLDLYVWEEVCRQIRLWTDSGIAPVPVSVNISQADLLAIDVPLALEELIEKYQIDRNLLKLEITESAFAGDVDVTEAAARLKQEGMTILMDDFGSGYSSLNILKSIDVDILKIDMDFLDWSDESVGRGENILEAVLHMTNLMDLCVIAEGVETKTQLDFLSCIGCNYVQGYYFYRPMPTPDIQALLLDATKVDHGGVQKDPIKLVDLEDIVKSTVGNKSVLDNILGGVAIYAVKDGCYELFQMNRQYRRITGDAIESIEKYRDDILSFIHPDDVKSAIEMFEEAERYTISGSQRLLRRLSGDGDTMWIQMRLFYLGKQDDRKLFYGSLTDATEWKKQQLALDSSLQELQESREVLDTILGVFDVGRTADEMCGDNKDTALQFFAQNAPNGFVGYYCDEGDDNWPVFFTNENLLVLLGYETYEEFIQSTEGMLVNAIHPEDRATAQEDVNLGSRKGSVYLSMYRLAKKDGTYLWVADQGRIFRSQNGRLAGAAAILDVSESMRLNEEIKLEDALLKSIIRLAALDAWVYDIEEDKITFLNVVKGGLISHFLAIDEEVEGESLSIEEFSEAVRATGRFRKDEKRGIFKLIYETTKGKHINEEIRVLTRGDEEERWLDVRAQTVFGSDGVPQRAIGFVRDVTERHQAGERE